MEEGPDDPLERMKYFMRKDVLQEWIEESILAKEINDREGYGRNMDRNLQAALTMNVTYRNCLFENNRQGPLGESGLPQFGVILMLDPANPTVVENSVFTNNSFDGSTGTNAGYLIRSPGAYLDIKNTCAFDNALLGYGPFEAYNGAQFSNVNNYVEDDPSLFCDFLATSDFEFPESSAEVTCVAATAKECRLLEQDSPTPPSGTRARPYMILLVSITLPLLMYQMFQ